MISSLTISSWQIKRTILYIKTTRQFITKVGIVLAQVTLQFTWEMHLVLNLHLLFPRRPFLRHESRTVCCILLRTIKINSWIYWPELRYAFNTLAAVTPDRTPYPKLRNAFGVNRRETFWRTLCWGTDFEGMDKQDLAVELCLIFFCATMTSLTRAKTEYILAYSLFLFTHWKDQFNQV